MVRRWERSQKKVKRLGGEDPSLDGCDFGKQTNKKRMEEEEGRQKSASNQIGNKTQW
jgi:hypothetical protein